MLAHQTGVDILRDTIQHWDPLCDSRRAHPLDRALHARARVPGLVSEREQSRRLPARRYLLKQLAGESVIVLAPLSVQP